MKVALLSGRPKNGTLLPKTEKFVWKEICRVMEEDLSSPILKGATFLIPIYSKFDLYGLAIAERQSNPVEYYVPSVEWGNKALPKHQLLLINRMKSDRHVIPSSHGRLLKMIEDADIVYTLPNTEGYERFNKYLENKTVCHLNIKKMNFTTEEEGNAYYETIKKNTEAYIQTKELNKETNLSETENLKKLFADAGIPLEFD